MDRKVCRYEVQLSTLRSQMLPGAIGSSMLGLIGVYLFWTVELQHSLLAWLLALILSSLLNYLYTLRTQDLTEYEARKALNIFTLLGLVAGLIWSVPAFWLASGQPEMIQPGFGSLFIIVAIMGLSTSAMGSTSAYLPFYYCSVTPFAFSLIFACYSADSSYYQLDKLFIALTLFFCAIYWFTFNINKGLINAIDLKMDNMILAEKHLIEKDKAEKANNEKSHFLAAASHDLRQPMQSLIMYTELLSDEVNNTKGKKLLVNVKASITNLKTLLTALLDISKLDANKFQVFPTQFSLQEMLSKLQVSFQQVAQEQETQLTFKTKDVWVNTDYGLLYSSLSNLIDNAIKHSKAKRILVAVRVKGQRVCLYIMDNGIGVASSEHSRIFKEFVQLENPERDREKGLGLGLSIVKRTLAHLKLDIAFSSERGRGTSFAVTLPLVENKQDTAQLSSIINFSLSSKTFWVIDDDREVRTALSSLIEKWGGSVIKAANEEDVITLLKNSEMPAPDMLISDFRLPSNTTGIYLISKIKAHFKLDIPSIIITGDTAAEQVNLLKQSGIPFLHKPVTGAKTRLLIKELLAL